MASETIYYCDRCGKRTGYSWYRLIAWTRFWWGGEWRFPAKSLLRRRLLCGECADSLVKWWKSPSTGDSDG